MRFATEHKMLGGLIVALASLGVVGAVSWMALERWHTNTVLVAHTRDVMGRLEELFSTLTDAQNGHRGYALTGDERFLEPYRRALAIAPTELAALKTLTADNPGQQRRLQALDAVITALLARSREIIEVRRTAGLEAAERETRSGKGKTLHDDFRRFIDLMKAEELALLRAREAEARRSVRITQAVIAGMGLLALGFIGLAALAVHRDFIGRRRAEAQLERFFSLSLDFLCIASVDGYFKRVSPAVTDILGWSVEEFLARPFMEFVHPEDRWATEREVERQIIEGEKVLWFENRYQHKNGGWRVLSWRSIPQPDGLMYATARDVTELKEAELALHEARDQLEQRVQERTAELMQTTTSLQIEVGERRGAQQKLLSQLQQLSLLQQITHAIGERQDIRSIFQVVVRTLEEEFPVDFCCICLYDPASDTLIVTSVGALSAVLAQELALAEQAQIAIDRNGLERCLRGELMYETDISGLPLPFPRRLASGGLRALVAAPLRVKSQVFGALIAARRQPQSFNSAHCEFLHQLSEHVALAAHQAQLYEALQRAYDDLRQTQQTVMQQERLRALGQMASGIAHDINNAISPITLYTESLLEREPGLSDVARRYLETIQRAIADVAQTVTRMREFYRPREGQMAQVAVDLNRLVQQVIDLTRARWRDMAHQRGLAIEMQTELAPELPAVLGTEGELREALTNLIFNAVDAMPQGGTLTLRTRATAAHVCLEVRDTGIGMDEETRRRCLEPFFTTKGERGTGLGLAMVYGTLQRHNADIEIESRFGHGTTIRLSFAIPVTPVIQPRPLAQALAPPAALRILVVDDDPVLINSLHDILSTDGHTLTLADGGQAGIDTLHGARERGESFDVVITDLGMPHVDGRKVAAAVKALDPAIPVILLTGWGQRLAAEGDIPPHVDVVLSKPPKLRELRETLAALSAPAAGDS